ncbi:MAG TPA: MMPL family transporter, partial [Micromonosporaceae bacterium]
MFRRLGGFVVRARWAAIAGALFVVAIGATWGSGVFGHLSSGGFLDPDSESAVVRAQIATTFGPQDADIFVLYSSPTADVTDPSFATPVKAALATAAKRSQVSRVVDYYATPSPALVSSNGRQTYAIVYLRAGSDDQKLADYLAIRSDFVVHDTTVTTQIGGVRAFYQDANTLTKSDVERAEAFSLPVLLVLLVFIFRSAVAAAAPLVIGGLAILGGFVVVRLLTEVTAVSTFAVNIITLIGLGLAIDYSLFMVSRFREEIDGGKTTADAVVATMSTAGRTVAVSGLTVTLAVAGLLIFPQNFLRSMGYGAMAAVAVAMIASLTVLPACLAILGPRINALRIPWPRRGRDGDAWARLARSVMRRPWLYFVGVLIVLAVLAAPVVHIRFGGIDTRALPASAPSRVVTDTIARDFPPTQGAPIQVLVTGDAAPVVSQIAALPSVTSAVVSESVGDSSLVTVDYRGEPTDPAAHRIVAAIRALHPAAGTTIGVTGATADLSDQLAGLGARLPWMLLFVIVVTCVLLF